MKFLSTRHDSHRRVFSAALALFALLCAALATQAQTAAKRPMTFQDVIEMRAVGAGKISPDGKLALYTVSIPQWKAGKNFTDLFVAPADGSSSPRQLTFTKEKNETQPQWARDSRTIGFLSDREGTGATPVNQLYLMPVDGGEAHRISDAKDGVNAFAFSHDGKWVAFSAGKSEDRQIWIARMDPAGTNSDARPVALTKHATPIVEWAWTEDSSRIFFTAPDRVDKDDEKRIEKKFDVKIMDPERPPVHLWSIPVAENAERPEKNEKRWTSGNDYSVFQFTLSRDSALLAFRSASTNRHANRTDQDDSEIYLLTLASGDIRRVTNNRVSETMPRFSPDSKWLAFAAPDEFAYLRNEKIYVTPTTGGAVRKLLPDWDHSANQLSWGGDSQTIYFFEGLGVDAHLFSVSLASGKLAQLTHERGVVSGPGFDEDTGRFLLAFTSPSEPSDYFTATPEAVADRGRWARVSRANPQTENLSLGEYETLHWKSSDSQTVEGLLIYPLGHEKGKRYPLIVQVHGGPAGAEENRFSANWGSYVHIFAAGGYAVFQPNYRGSSNYGEKFRMQIATDYFRQGYDDIITGVDALIARVASPTRQSSA